MTATADLSTVMPDATLARLRAQYSAEYLLAVSRNSVEAPHPPAAGFAQWVVGYLYDARHLKPADRERTLVALLASQSAAPSLMLSIHLYWGLMEGLGVVELADVLALSGAYTGLPRYTAGLITLRRTLDSLVALAAPADAKLDPAAVIGALFKAFP